MSQKTQTEHTKALARQRQRENYARQARMPEESRPRWSPRRSMPRSHQGVLPTDLTSMRTCVENPEDYPNDFRYLFRVTGTPLAEPQYIWLDIDGERKPNRVFPSLFQAIEYYISRKWEDASW